MRIIATAPMRLSFFGGGTDVSPFSTTYGGEIINLAINIKTTVLLENGNLNYKESNLNGLGGSGSLLVAILGALKKWNNLPIDKQEIAEEAFDIEVNQWKWHGGWQDQFAASFGGFNYLNNNPENKVKVTPLPKDQIEDFLPWLVLFDTGIKRDSFKIQEGFKEIEKNDIQLDALTRLKFMVIEAKQLFAKKAYLDLARLLDKIWKYKKLSNNVTNKKLNNFYRIAKRNGAIGGKIMGAGQGGCFLFAIRPISREWFIKKMESEGLKYIPFKPCYNGLEVKCEQ